MASSASAQSFSYLDSSEPLSATCRRVGSEPLSIITSTLTNSTTPTAPTSPTLRRRSSYIRRSQKAMHRAAIRRIITVSNQQQQQQKDQQQCEQHYSSSSSSSCRSSSAPQLPLCSSDLSRLGVVTQAVLKDHHPSLLSSNEQQQQKQKQQQRGQAPSSPLSPTTITTTTTKTTPSCTKATRHDIPPSITTRRVISSSCPHPATTAASTTPTSATPSSNSTAYYSISSSSPLHTASSSINTNIHSSASFPSFPLSSSSFTASSSPLSHPHPLSSSTSSSCPNISCGSDSSNRCTSSQLYTGPSPSPSFCDSTSFRPSRHQGSTTLDLQHASSRHNNPRIQQQEHQHQHSSTATGPLTAPAPTTTTETPWRALHISLLDQEDKAAVRRHSAGESVWKRIVQQPGETLFGRLRSGSVTTATEAITTIAPRQMIFKPQKPPPRTSTTTTSTTTHPLFVNVQTYCQQPPHLTNSTGSVDYREVTHRLYPPQKSECNSENDGQFYSRKCDDGDASECFYSYVNALGKEERIQDIDISSSHHHYQQSRWSALGVTQCRDDKQATVMSYSTIWSQQQQQHTTQQQQVPNTRPRPQGRYRRHYTRVANDIQRRPSLRTLHHHHHQEQQQQQQNRRQQAQALQTQIAHQQSPRQPRTQTDSSPRQRLQLSARHMRYLSTKPLPLLSRSTSSTSSRSRKRSIGPSTTTYSRYKGFRFSQQQLNKPLPPIPNAVNPCIGGFPTSASKECIDGLFAPLDRYHEARSNMIGFGTGTGIDSAPSWDWRGSKEELASLLPLGRDIGGSKEAIDATTMEQGEKQDVDDGDSLPCVDRSESKEELIVATSSTSVSMSVAKEELVLSSSEKGDEDEAEKGKDASLLAHRHKAGLKNEEYSPTISTTTTTQDSPFIAATASSLTAKTTNPSPTSAAALSLKRLESFRFPLRKSPIEKSNTSNCSMARHPARLLQLHQHHQGHHGHHHSLPYNTITATYAHHSSKAAFDVCNQTLLLTASGLVSGSNVTSNAVASTTTVEAGATATALSRQQGGETGCTNSQDAKCSTSSPSPTGLDGEGSAVGEGDKTTTMRRHDSGWVSERYRRQIGHQHHQQRVHLRRSESCSNISLHHQHRPSLSFNSSKKALLSLQTRRVNKPDAKVVRLPEIHTCVSTTVAITPTTGLLVLQSRAGTGIFSGNEGGLLGLKTTMATAVHLDTVRTTKAATTAPCDQQLFVLNEVVAPSATIDSPQDDTDYQLRVSEQDRVVVDSILTELVTDTTGTEVFKSEKATMVKDDVVYIENLVDMENSLDSSKEVSVSAHRDSVVPAQETDPTTAATEATTIIAASAALGSTTTTTEKSASESSSSETPNVSAALDNAFKIIESRPVVIDAGEIKRFVKRSHALQELESTEKSYVDDLDVLAHVYMRVLETKSWFPANIHANMRQCVMGLLVLHRNFLSQIQVYRLTSESDHEKRAPLNVYRTLEIAFLALSRDHKLYSQFCELRMRTLNEINRTVGQSTLSVLQKESKELMAQQGRPRSRTDLKDHLIKPIQRICRYPLLLKEILRLTSSEDPEYEFIDRAHECMRTLAQQMDETQRMVERKLLTEQFLKRLPETNPPKKYGVTLAPLHVSNSNNSNSDSNNHHRQGSSSAIHPLASHPRRPSTELELFEGGPFGEGILPSNLTKTYAGTLSSIVLAGALEYVIMPDIPIRLRYYGCFLFESMLIVVKAKKTSLYEPRQWLPLRLCEIYETTRLDGYTRFGWRIMYDQFRIDFGASCEAERQVWMSALQTHIQAAKVAHARLPRVTANLENVVSSLPWNMARPPPPPPISTLFPSYSGSTGSMSMIASASGTGSSSSRHVQVYHQPPSPTPSPWSTCSSAIPSPLMPPPPMATCSTSSTMMMAMSFMTNTESEKWNDRGTPGVSLDAYAQYYEQHIHPHAHESVSGEAYDPSRLNLTRHLSVESSYDDAPRGYGMAGNRVGNSNSAFTNTIGTSGPQQDSSLNRSISQPRTRSTNESYPLSARKSESAASGHLLFPSTAFPWLVPEPRPRSHSFDVTRVFASSHSGGIKPNQRNLVQSMFKDVSTENIWTTTSAATTTNNHSNHPQPSPQSIPSANALSSPMTYRAGRYSTPLPFSYFNNNSPSTSTTTSGSSAPFSHPPTSPMATAGMVSVSGLSYGHSGSTFGSAAVGREDDETPVSTPTLQSAGSSCSSLTSRLLRRRDSGTSAKVSPNGPLAPTSSSSDKNEWDRRRSSATAAIVAATSALNFRKNSEPGPSVTSASRNSQNQHHRRRLSIPDSVALLFNNHTDHTGGGSTTSARDGSGGIYQRISVKARAQLIEKKAAHGELTPSSASTPSLAPPSRNKSKKGVGGFGGGKLKSSMSSQDLASSFAFPSSASSLSLTSMNITSATEEGLAASSLLAAEIDHDILNSLSSAAAEAVRSRRGGGGGNRSGSSERIQRRSVGAALAMTSIDAVNTPSSSISTPTTGTAGSFTHLHPSTSTHSLPVYFPSNNSSTQSLTHAPLTTESHSRDTAEKIWMAMGRLTHKRSAGDRHGPLSLNRGQQQQVYAHASNQSSSSFVGESAVGKVIESHRSLCRPSIHVSENSSSAVPSSGGISLVATEASSRPSSMHLNDGGASASNSGRNHYRTVSESTVQSIDSVTSLMSDGSIPQYHQDILGGMMSSSPSSVPRLTLTPSGSTRSRSSSNSSVHSSLLSIHDQSNSLAHMNDPQYYHHQHRGKEQQYDARQPPLSWSFSNEHHHGENGISGGMAVGTISPRSLSRRSASSGSRKSMSSSSASSLSPTFHYHQDPTLCQLQPPAFQFQDCTVDNNKTVAPSAAAPPGNFQDGHANPQTLYLAPSIQDRRKSSSILQNLSQASQKFRTLIRSPTTVGNGMRRRTVMSLSPITMGYSAAAGAMSASVMSGGGTGVRDVLIVLQEGEREGGREREVLGEEIDVAPFVSDKDMDEIFGSEQQQQQWQYSDDDSTITSV